MTFKFRNKEIKKISWIFYSQLLQIISQFVNIIFLTRLFDPNDFGVFAVGMIIISLVNQVFILGFSAPLIQFDNHNRYYGTGWTINLIISMFVTMILILIIPIIVKNFLPEYVDYIYIYQLVSTSVLIVGLNNIGVIELYRKRQTKKLFFLRGFMEFLKVGLTVIYFYFFPDYRALFFSFLTISVIRLILTYIIAPIKIKVEIKIDLFKKLFNFSKWIQLKNISKVFSSQFDSVIVASLLSPIGLGIYNRSMIISKVPEQLFQNINDLYSYPILSKNKDNPTFIKKYFDSFLIILIMIASNVVLFVNLFGKEFINLILGKSWVGISEPLGILIFTMCINSVLSAFIPFVRALGFPKIEFKLSLYKTIILVIISYPLIHYFGLIGAAFSTLISAILIVPSFLNLTKPIIGEYVKNIYGFMIIWILPAIIIINLYEFSFINPLQFILNIIGFLVVYNIISISMILYFYPKVKFVQFFKSL